MNAQLKAEIEQAPPDEPTEIMSTDYWRKEAWKTQDERDQLRAQVAELQKQVEALKAVARAASNGPCRHDNTHTGLNCRMCNALVALKESGVGL